MYVIKRDGTRVLFDPNKIVKAINKAMISVDGALYETDTAEEIANLISNQNKDMSVEYIQDLVEQYLMKSERPDVAKAYILYRDQRTKARTRNSKLITAVMKRNEATAVENANANVDEKSFSGREKEASADVQKLIALDYTLSPEISLAHKNMLLYQHDLEKTNIGEHNCLFVDFDNLFTNGFVTRNGDIRPPSSYSTACQQVAVIFQCQSQVQFGGVGTVHLDYDLKPFVKKSFRKHMRNYFTDVEGYSKESAEALLAQHEPIEIDNVALTETAGDAMKIAYRYAVAQLEREGTQSSEALFHNLNTLESRAGSQVPFTSINFGRDESTEGRLVTKWMLNASLAGVGRHHLTPIFPISIFQYKQGCNANPEDPNYDLKQLALKSLSKRIYPNFVNCDYSQANETIGNPDTYFATMGCRTMLGYDRFSRSYNRVGRGNLTPNTMILPKLGIEYGICLGQRTEPDLDGFWSAFEDLLMLCEQGLLERFDIMVNQPPESAPFMYQNGTMKDSQKCKMSNYEALKHGTLAMGYIGIAEMCQALFGKNHAEDRDVHAFALKVVKRINDYAKEASERHNLNFSCYATPAEGLCHTAAKALRKQYGTIPNVTDHEFLTNSHHVPVWHQIGIFEKLAIEAPFCKYPTGGCITYVELDSTFVKNVKAIEQIIDYAFKELDIPYLAFNFPIDSCLDCGFQGEFNDACPECGSENIQQLRRVTGYLTTDYRHFNKGKQSEVEHRIKHSQFS
jgi:ribonucleoside-triphosphate reductase